MLEASLRFVFLLMFTCSGSRMHGPAASGAMDAFLAPAASRIRHSKPNESCNASTVPLRSLSSWCEEEGIIDEYITYEPIRKGHGLCLDGICYDAISLRAWLQKSEVLPHNRESFSIGMLNDLLGIRFKTLMVENTAVVAVAFREEGVMTGTISGMLQLWDVETDEELETYVGHRRTVASIQVSADGTKVLTGSLDRTARLWDIEEEAEIQCFRGHRRAVTSVALSPDRKTVLSGSDDKTVRLWNAEDGQELQQLHVPGVIAGVAFRPPSGSEVCASVAGGRIILWDAETGKERYRLRANTALFHPVAFSPSGDRATSSADDSSVTIWDANTGEVLHRLRGHSGFVQLAAFSPDGKVLLTSSALANDPLLLLDVASGVVLQSLSAAGIKDVSSIAFSPDGRQIAVAAAGLVHVFELGAAVSL